MTQAEWGGQNAGQYPSPQQTFYDYSAQVRAAQAQSQARQQAQVQAQQVQQVQPQAGGHGGGYVHPQVQQQVQQGGYGQPQAPYGAQQGQMQQGQMPRYGGSQPGQARQDAAAQAQYHAQDHDPRQAYGGAPEPEGYFASEAGGAFPRLGRAASIAGAAVSLALVAGLAVWGYQLAVRDVTGIPVVRALEGPMRIQPEEPGGVAAAHQGLAVNAVAAAGQAEGPTDQVSLAPAPVGLAVDDVPAQAGAEVSAMSMAEAEEELSPEAAMAAEVAVTAPAALTEDPGDPVAEALALAEAVAREAQPLTGGQADISMTPEATARLEGAAVPGSVPGLARSPRPAPRPADLTTRAEASPVALALASADAATASAVRDVAADTIAAGTRLVQLGAFDSAEVAQAEWTKIAARFEEMLDDKARVIEKAQSGGKTFYRLRAMGFEDLNDARRFCSALMAGQAACIPVVTR